MRRAALVILATLLSHVALVSAAGNATPTPQTGGADILAAVTFPAGTQPPDPTEAWLYRATLVPGGRLRFPDDPATGARGVALHVVLAGTYVLRPAGPVEVLGGRPPVAGRRPDAEVILGARGAVAFAFGPGATPEIVNPGPASLEFVGGIVATAPSPPPPAALSIQWYDGPVELPGRQSEPLALTLGRLTLAPSAILPASSSGDVRLAVGGAAGLVPRDDGSRQNTNVDPLTVYVLTVSATLPGTPTAAATPALSGLKLPRSDSESPGTDRKRRSAWNDPPVSTWRAVAVRPRHVQPPPDIPPVAPARGALPRDCPRAGRPGPALGPRNSPSPPARCPGPQTVPLVLDPVRRSGYVLRED